MTLRISDYIPYLWCLTCPQVSEMIYHVIPLPARGEHQVKREQKSFNWMAPAKCWNVSNIFLTEFRSRIIYSSTWILSNENKGHKIWKSFVLKSTPAAAPLWCSKSEKLSAQACVIVQSVTTAWLSSYIFNLRLYCLVWKYFNSYLTMLELEG